MFQVVLLGDSLQGAGHFLLTFFLDGLFPFFENRFRDEHMIFFCQAVDASECLPVCDHQKGQNTEKHIGSWKKGRQAAYGKKKSFSDEKQNVFCSLSLEEKEKTDLDAMLRAASRVQNLDLPAGCPEDLLEGLFLHHCFSRQKHELFFGFFPELFPSGKCNLYLSKRFRGKVHVFFSVIFDKDKMHFPILTIRREETSMVF